MRPGIASLASCPRSWRRSPNRERSAPRGRSSSPKAAAEAVITALQKDRADSEKWLRSDATSYLATIARKDFGDRKTLTIGRAADNDVGVGVPGIAPTTCA